MTTKRISIVAATLIAAALLITPAARAGEFADKIPDLVWVDIGGTIDEVTTNAAVTGPNGIGPTIDFEEVFDIPGSKTTFAIQGTARVSEKRRHVDFGYVDIARSGTDIIDQDITWGGNTYQAGANVTAEFNTAFIYGAYRYDFLNEDKIRLSGSAGLSWVDLGTGLKGNGTYTPPTGPPVTGDFNSSESIGLPVPLIGFNIDWAVAKGLVVRSYNRFFRMNLKGINGGMYESGIHLNWYFIKNLGIGFGFDRTEIKLKEYELSNGNNIKFDYVVSGFGLYATLAF
jgi:hypothetical protein